MTWTGDWLDIEFAVPKNKRNRRLIGKSPVPVGPGVEIWRCCRFLGMG